MRYKRVMLKLSGGAIAGSKEAGFDPSCLEHIADELLRLSDIGIEVAAMVGGGNIFRGELGERWGIERPDADNIGMMATLMNSLLLKGVIESKTTTTVKVMSSIGADSVAEPFLKHNAVKYLEQGAILLLAGGTANPYVTTDLPSVLRARELHAEAVLAAKCGVDGVYTSDPKTDVEARRYQTLSYHTAISQELEVMDLPAIVKAQKCGLPIHVFDFDAEGAMLDICRGFEPGTIVTEAEDHLA